MASLSELLYDIKRISEHRKELTDKKIRKIYQSLSKSLDAFIADGYKKYADEEGRFYVSSLDAQNKKALFLREIAENVNSIALEIKKEIMTLVDDTYSKSYQGMMNAFKKADTSEEFEEATKNIDVNPNVLKNAVNNNISKLTLPAVLEKHRQEVIYQIQKELNIGLMQGDRYEKMAKRISERVNVSYNKAMNITRTETHRNIESGFMDCAEHIQEGLEDSELIYAVTWRTMKDERVRPNQRRKTKKGWVTSKSKNGANHQKMENVTVKAGELFDLGGGIKAKAPSQTGVASHDCNCRCFLEYNLMTVEEFEKATGKKVSKKEYTQDRQIIIDKNNKTEQTRKGTVIVASKVSSIKNRDVYVSDKAKLKPNHIREINNDISKVLDLLGEKDNPNIPKIIITTSRELDDRVIASFNPAKNLIYVSENIAKADDDAILAIQSDFVCPENKLSTLTHEFIHWQDRDRYIRNGNIINSAEEFQKYINGLRKDCKKKLDRLEKKGYDIGDISDYAYTKYNHSEYDETYTEYRTKRYLEEMKK